MHHTGDSQPVLGLSILDRVPADDRDSSLIAHRRAAPQDRDKQRLAQLRERERDHIQRTHRLAAHRVDVGERVGSGDPPEVERIIDDRGEEVDRVDQREVLPQPVDPRVIGGLEADQHVGIIHTR